MRIRLDAGGVGQLYGTEVARGRMIVSVATASRVRETGQLQCRVERASLMHPARVSGGGEMAGCGVLRGARRRLRGIVPRMWRPRPGSEMPEIPDVSAIAQQVKARIKQIEDQLKQHEAQR